MTSAQIIVGTPLIIFAGLLVLAVVAGAIGSSLDLPSWREDEDGRYM